MEISVTHDEPVSTFLPTGRLDALGASILDQHLATLPLTTRFLILGLAAVHYVSSVGIRFLVNAKKLLSQRSGALILAELDPAVYQVLETAGLISHFQIADTLTDAQRQIEAAQSGAPSRSGR